MYRLSTIIATFNLSIILSFICKLMNYLDVGCHDYCHIESVSN